MKKHAFTFFVLQLFFVVSSLAQQAGMLDSTFNFDGKVIDSVTLGDKVFAIAIQPDGKIIAGGSSALGNTQYLSVYRFNNDGSFDLTFGTNGQVLTALGTGTPTILDIALQPDGKIVASGNWYFNLIVVRYNTNGSPDSTFGTNGVVITYMDFQIAVGDQIAIASNGKIYAAGGANSSDIGIVRFNPDGTLDTTFNQTGKLIVDLGGFEYAQSIALQPDGKLMIASIFYLLRITESGTLDTTFNHSGFVNVPHYVFSIALQMDGEIIAGGRSGEDFSITRFNSDGSIDSTFPQIIQSIQTGYNEIRSVKIQQDGKILAAGSSSDTSNSNADFALACYNADGSKDLTFGINGVVLTGFDNGSSNAYDMAIQPDNKIVLGGITTINGRFDITLSRYFSGLVGIDELGANNSRLLISPNPTSSNSPITFTYPSTSAQKQIIINDINGIEVVRYTLPQWSSMQHLKLPPISSGIYIARLIGAGTAANVKFVVSSDN